MLLLFSTKIIPALPLKPFYPAFACAFRGHYSDTWSQKYKIFLIPQLPKTSFFQKYVWNTPFIVQISEKQMRQVKKTPVLRLQQYRQCRPSNQHKRPDTLMTGNGLNNQTCLGSKRQFLLKVTLYDLNICHICLFDKWGFMMVQSYTSSACIGLYIVSTTLRWHSSASERGWVLISIRTQDGSRCASFRILGSSNST